MKIIEKDLIHYEFKLVLTQEEALGLEKELGNIIQETTDSYVCPRAKSYNAKLFMVLHDVLEDLNLVEKTPNRNKGDKSYPRLENDNVEVEEK